MQQPEEKQINPKMLSTPQHLKKVIDAISGLKKDLENATKAKNQKVAKNQETKEEEGQLIEINLKLEELMIEFRSTTASTITNLKNQADKWFIRFGDNYMRKDNQLKGIIEEIAIGQGIQPTLRGQKNEDLIVFTIEDKENDFDIYKKMPRNVGHPRDRDDFKPKPQVKDQEQKQQQQQPQPKQKPVPVPDFPFYLPPDDIKEIIVNADIEKQDSIAIRFNKPDDNDNMIDKYQICLILDYSIDNLQLNPQQEVIAEIYSTSYGICHTLQFNKINKKMSSIIPYDQFLKLTVQAHNKYGWSNHLQQYYVNLYCQYKIGSSLFLIGLIPLTIQPYLELIEQPIIQEDKLIVNQISLILMETGTIKQVSSKFGSTIIVNLNFKACQWGKILNFEDEEKTESFEVNPKDFDVAMPYQIDTIKAISKVSCGFYHSLATTVDGQVLAWGLNNFGQLGNGTTQSRFSPYELSYFKNQEIYVIDVQAADCISMCRTIKGEVYCWGKQQNVYGNQCFKVINRFKETINLQCFDPTNSQTQPRKIINLEAKQIAIGQTCFAAISKDDSVYMWGQNDLNVFGFTQCEDLEDQQINHLMDPIKLQVKGNEIQLGGYHCIVKVDKGTHDEFISWGWNKYGQCGQKFSEIETYGTILTLPQTKYTQFSCGYNHSLFLTKDNKVYGLGNNQFGQISNNMKIPQTYKPLQVETGNIKIDNIHCGENISYILGD